MKFQITSNSLLHTALLSSSIIGISWILIEICDYTYRYIGLKRMRNNHQTHYRNDDGFLTDDDNSNDVIRYFERMRSEYYVKIISTLMLKGIFNSEQMSLVIKNLSFVHTPQTPMSKVETLIQKMVGDKQQLFDEANENSIIQPYVYSNHIHIPVILRLYFTCKYWNTINFLKNNGYFITFEHKYHIIKYNYPKNNQKSKNLIIFFHGLDGIFAGGGANRVYSEIKEYSDVLIPIYTPISMTYHQNFDGSFIDFAHRIMKYISENEYETIDIFAVSIGGLVAQSFIQHFRHSEMIRKVIFVEPVCLLRSACLCLGANYRKYFDLVDMLNKFTIDRYQTKNYILAYLIHCSTGRAAFWSIFEPLRIVEWGNVLNRFDTHVFISDYDPLINHIHDKHDIDNTLNKCKIYRKEGYHFGWFISSKLICELKNIYS